MISPEGVKYHQDIEQEIRVTQYWYDVATCNMFNRIVNARNQQKIRNPYYQHYPAGSPSSFDANLDGLTKSSIMNSNDFPDDHENEIIGDEAGDESLQFAIDM